MKKLLLVTALALMSFTGAQSQVEFKVVTSVESIVPNGMGRSRLISANEVKDHKEFTTTQTEDDNGRNKSEGF